MEWKDLIIDGYGRVSQILAKALNGLDPADLTRQPHPDCNSLGWLAWHLTRIQDHHLADLMAEEQLWISQQWYAKFNRQPDPSDIGWGHTSEDVALFTSPDVKTLLEYHRAVMDRSIRYLVGLSEADLSREINEPMYQPLPTVGVRLVSVMSDNLQHAGQVAYLRGLLKGNGWWESSMAIGA